MIPSRETPKRKVHKQRNSKRRERVNDKKSPPNLISTHGTESFSYEKIYFMSALRCGNKLRKFNLKNIFSNVEQNDELVELREKPSSHLGSLPRGISAESTPMWRTLFSLKTLIKKFQLFNCENDVMCAPLDSDRKQRPRTKVNASYFFCASSKFFPFLGNISNILSS